MKLIELYTKNDFDLSAKYSVLISQLIDGKCKQ